jgi:hypothetical protein
MKNKCLGLLLSVAVLGWMAGPATAATPPPKPKPAKPPKDTEAGAAKTEFKDVPTLQDGPGKGYYAIVQTKFYDALFVASNLTVQFFPKENGERIDKPVILDNRFVYKPGEHDPKDLMTFSGVRNLAPPAVNPVKLVITAVNDAGTVLIQTWKFAEGKIEVENHLKGFTGDPPTMRTYIKFPQTHKFTPNIEKSDREKQMAGYQYIIRGGKTENAMKTLKLSYANKVENLSVSDSVENEGPWGSRKITIKRKSGKGSINYGGEWNKMPYDGLEFAFGTRADPKTKKLDVQGFELKVE